MFLFYMLRYCCGIESAMTVMSEDARIPVSSSFGRVLINLVQDLHKKFVDMILVLHITVGMRLFEVDFEVSHHG